MIWVRLFKDHRLARAEPQLLALAVRVSDSDEGPRLGVARSGVAMEVSNVVDGGDLRAVKAVGPLARARTIDHFKVSRMATDALRND